MRLTLMNMGPLSVYGCAADDEEGMTFPPNVHIIIDDPEIDLFTIGEADGEDVITLSVTNDGDGEVLVVIGDSGESTAVQPGKNLLCESMGYVEIRE
jgi:hypothetical protein